MDPSGVLSGLPSDDHCKPVPDQLAPHLGAVVKELAVEMDREGPAIGRGPDPTQVVQVEDLLVVHVGTAPQRRPGEAGHVGQRVVAHGEQVEALLQPGFGGEGDGPVAHIAELGGVGDERDDDRLGDVAGAEPDAGVPSRPVPDRRPEGGLQEVAAGEAGAAAVLGDGVGAGWVGGILVGALAGGLVGGLGGGTVGGLGGGVVPDLPGGLGGGWGAEPEAAGDEEAAALGPADADPPYPVAPYAVEEPA